VDWTVSRALLELSGNGQLGEDEEPLAEVFAQRGVQVERFFQKDMVRGRIEVTPTTLVAGTLPSVAAALREVGSPLPEPFDYPEPLREFLHRRVWMADLGWVRAHIEAGGAPVFVKPRLRRKRFTGLVIRYAGDLYALAPLSKRTALWCSDVVSFSSEHRVFVVEGRVVGVSHYDGDPQLLPSHELIDACREKLVDIAGYALDVGVLDDGTSALVEANDGFALGRYDLDPNAYADMLAARWRQLVLPASATMR